MSIEPLKLAEKLSPENLPSLPIKAIEEAIRSVRFGTVQIVIQDGHIIQIDKTEKIRLK